MKMIDDGCRWPSTQASRLWLLGCTCWEMTNDSCRWPGTQASRVSHHVVHTRDMKYVAGVLSNVAELPLLMWCPVIREAAQSKGEGRVVCPELERAALHLEPEAPDSTEGGQKLPVESAVGDLSAVQLLGEETQQLPWATWVALLMKAAPTWVALVLATRASLA